MHHHRRAGAGAVDLLPRALPKAQLMTFLRRLPPPPPPPPPRGGCSCSQSNPSYQRRKMLCGLPLVIPRTSLKSRTTGAAPPAPLASSVRGRRCSGRIIWRCAGRRHLVGALVRSPRLLRLRSRSSQAHPCRRPGGIGKGCFWAPSGVSPLPNGTAFRVRASGTRSSAEMERYRI